MGLKNSKRERYGVFHEDTYEKDKDKKSVKYFTFPKK